MRNLTIVIAMLLLCSASNSFSQSFINQPGLLLKQVTDTLQAGLSPADTGEGGGTDQLGFFNTFWSSRVYRNDSSGTNMFVQYQHALREAVVARMSAGSCSSGFSGNWQPFGPDSIPGYQRIGKIDAVWADPTDSNYILAGATGGLFKTTDGGKNWHCITDNALVVGGVTGVGSIAVNPLNRDTLLLGTAILEELGIAARVLQAPGGAGILETNDGGATWQQEFVPITGGFGDTVEEVYGVYFTPGADRIYAFVNNDIYTRSNHPKGNWQKITPPELYSTGSFVDLQFVPGDPNHFFVSSVTNYSGVFEANATLLGDSISSISWSEISFALPTTTVSGDVIKDTDYFRFAISVPDADTLYATGMSIHNAYNTILYKYNISGATHSWSQWCSAMPTDPYENNPSWLKMKLVVSPANPANIYYGGDILCMSADYGQTFHEIGGYYTNNNHADVRGLCLQTAGSVANGAGDFLLTANDGGVGKKPSGINAISIGVNSMVSINGFGLYTADVWGIGTSYDGSLMVDGEQHDGIMAYEKKQSPAWTSIDNDGDAYIAGFDNEHSTGIVFNNENGSVSYPNQPMKTQPYGSRQLGVSFGISGNDIPDGFINDYNGGENPCIYVDPSGNQYVGMHTLWKLNSGTTTWNDYGTPIGLPDSNTTCDMVFSLYDTSLTGYVLYNPNGGNQVLEYRNQSGTGLSNFNATTAVPGAPTYPMTCVTIDPLNPQKVWVGMGGISYYTTSKYRVQYSPDAGSTWYDVSNGLPVHMPVTKIIYQEGSSNVYCATDVGIYKCDFSTFDTSATNYGIEWTCFNNGAVSGTGFPNAYVTDLKINYCQNKLYAATYGRSIWSTDLDVPWGIVAKGDTITTSTIWTTNKYMTSAIVVQPGVTLTFSGDTIHMPRNGTIIVRPGGRLIVSHAVVTNECEGCLWFGIEALGHPNLPQNPTNQAWVEIDSSVIENARYAVANDDRWNFDTANGGIIQCNGSNFINNHVSASFYNYHNVDSLSLLHDDLSYFWNCTFLLDSAYKGDSWGYPFLYHCFISEVEGIGFNGCQFLNRSNNPAERGQGEGIHSYDDGGFAVRPFCSGAYTSGGSCTGTYAQPRFCGFRNGISVQGTGATVDVPVTIDQVAFDSVSVGVNISSAANVSTTRSIFSVGYGQGVLDIADNPVDYCEQNIGILAQNAYNFRIEGNTFTGPALPNVTWDYIGTVVANSTMPGYYQMNKVYRNTFDSLTQGVAAIGCNTFYGSLLPPTGLQVLCNTFSHNGTDIAVLTDGGSGQQGICIVQAGHDSLGYLPAGNTFSGSTNKIVNNGAAITYYYDSSNLATEYPSLSGANIMWGLTRSKACEPTFSSSGGGFTMSPVKIDPGEINTYVTSLFAASTLLFDSLAVYDSAIDLGYTSEIIALIDSTTDSATLYFLYYVGTIISPYLSAAVLKEAITVDRMYDSEVVNLLLLNPDALRNPDLLPLALSYVRAIDSTDGHTTDYTDSVLNAIQRTTPRTSLEASMETSLATLCDDVNVLMMPIRASIDTGVSVHDTTGAGICTDPTNVYYMRDSNSYYFWLSDLAGTVQFLSFLWPQYDRVGYYNFMGQYDVADSVFTSIFSSETSQTADSTYYRVWNVLHNAETHGRSAMQLNSEDIASLDTTSAPVFSRFRGDLILRNITTNIMSASSAITPAPSGIPCVLSSSSGSRKAHTAPPGPHKQPVATLDNPGIYGQGDNINGKTGSQFAVYPNPASGIVTFAYNVPQAADITITVTNILGEKMMELNTGTSAGKAYWDASHEPSGVYFYVASSGNGIINKGKVVITR